MASASPTTSCPATGTLIANNFNPPPERQRADTVPGSTFSEVADLCTGFDRKLRALVHDGIERIEITHCARIVGEWIVTHGPLAHQKRTCPPRLRPQNVAENRSQARPTRW